MKYADKPEITQTEYVQIVGLLTIAKKHNDALRDIEEAVCQITGEEPQSGGHSGDAVYGESDADGLLKKLGITVTG